ncbi:GntR family transcriptional regulator [Roseomonas mucosa]|uniref:GntR family transcriptional regulator n=1 Tax=Roseomonas mucosa TaxID=207340 RepID=UPI00223EF579|nr:GntR family transcriptional regulator [Roseomonas mucosa]
MAPRLASQILDHIREEALPPGTRLTERRLAELLRVSRNPVRSALQLLAQRGMVSGAQGEGYAVTDAALRAEASSYNPDAVDQEEQTYLSIAEDRLSGQLPDRISESEMMRRYELTRAQLARLLRRIDSEGWAARLPGHGWEFTPVLTARETYYESFRFRVLVEPAGILEPTFKLDRASLEACRQEQDALVAGRAAEVSPAQLFDANVRVHEAIAACSGNTFFLDSLRRINRLRRLVEYRKIVDRTNAVERCKQHVIILDLLLQGDQDSAASLMRFHITQISGQKSGPI